MWPPVRRTKPQVKPALLSQKEACERMEKFVIPAGGNSRGILHNCPTINEEAPRYRRVSRDNCVRLLPGRRHVCAGSRTHITDSRTGWRYDRAGHSDGFEHSDSGIDGPQSSGYVPPG